MKKHNVLRRCIVPIAALAVAALLSWSFGAVRQADAAPGDPEFHIGINTDGAGGDDCSTLNDTKGFCSVPLGSMFVVNGYLDSLGSAANYDAVTVWEDYTEVTSKGVHNSDAHPWPNCAFEGIAAYPGYTIVGCLIGLGPSSKYTGKVTTATYTCTADGTITMRHGIDNTSILANTGYQFEQGPDVLNIRCFAPSLGGVAAYPELPGSANGGLLALAAVAGGVLTSAGWWARRVVR